MKFTVSGKSQGIKDNVVEFSNYERNAVILSVPLKTGQSTDTVHLRGPLTSV